MEQFITESGMRFGPFPEEHLFHIEASPYYRSVQSGMSICEFVFHRADEQKLLLVEAKTTAPNPNSPTAENPRLVFQNYISGIRDKLINALDLYIHLALRQALPSGFQTIDYNHIEIVLILVIQSSEEKWLRDVQDALNDAVTEVLRANRIWKCRVAVLNHSLAVRHRLVQPNP